MKRKIGLPTEEYDKQIFELRCRIFAPEVVKELFKEKVAVSALHGRRVADLV